MCVRLRGLLETPPLLANCFAAEVDTAHPFFRAPSAAELFPIAFSECRLKAHRWLSARQETRRKASPLRSRVQTV